MAFFMLALVFSDFFTEDVAHADDVTTNFTWSIGDFNKMTYGGGDGQGSFIKIGSD